MLSPALIALCSFFITTPPVDDAIPRGLHCLRSAYPQTVCAMSGKDLTLCNGKVIPWDEGASAKDVTARLEAPDLKVMMAERYKTGREFEVPPPDFEPGRRRVDPFFKAMYGETKREVAATLVPVAWMPKSGGKTVKVTRINGASDALKRVSDELERVLPRDMLPLAASTAGVFNWRTVRHSKRQSPHSYAIAIDIGVKWSDYWNWNKPKADGSYAWKNRFPLEIVEVFEKHGFIWGGKWSHFDTMHFEYRPELLVAPCVDGAPFSPR